MTYKHRSGDGYIIIITLVLMAIVVVLVSSLVGYTRIQVQAHRQAINREKALNIAEAGIEAALWKLNNVSGYSGETNTAYGGGVYTVTLSNVGSGKLLKVDSYLPNATSPISHRTVQITLGVGTKNIGFAYGVQVGNGGFVMDNNSQVTGNVYANNSITGANGATITGDVIVAGASGSVVNMTVGGNVTAHTITNTTVTGNANANTINGGSKITKNVSAAVLSSCTITGNAIYNSKSSCSVGGTSTTPNPSVPSDPVAQPLPIDSTQISDWEQQASDGTAGLTTIVSGTSTIGPSKITGDLIVNGTLILTGTVWVTGSITVANGATVKLSPGYGTAGGVLMAGTGNSTSGVISISNGAILQGSGTAGSYILILSEMNSVTTTAITVSNNATGAIIYAGNGIIDVSNNAAIKEITAYKIHLNNNAVVTYNSGLASASFSSGPSGGYEVTPQSWQLLR